MVHPSYEYEEPALVLAQRYADVVHPLPFESVKQEAREKATDPLLIATKYQIVSFDLQYIAHPYIKLLHRWAQVHNVSLEYCKLSGNVIGGYRQVSFVICSP